MSEQTAKWLRQVAEEIRKENHAGWGNTCEMAADEVDAMQARIDELTEAARNAVEGYEAYAESGFEEVLDPPMIALAALLEAEK